MAFTKIRGHQRVRCAYVDGLTYIAGMGETSGAAFVICTLPAGATVVGGEIIVDTASDSATSSNVDIGDSVDDDRYTASPVNLKSAARTALTLTGFKTTAQTDIKAIVTETGAATTGAFRVLIQYVVDDVEDLVVA